MTTYSAHRNLPYTGPFHPRRCLDLFLPSTSSSDHPLFVFIHGGAWRSESKDDFTHTLVPNLLKHVELPLAVLEYRLAPTSPHPAQINDVVSGLELLTNPALLPCEGGQARWNRRDLIVAGHSAGAFMAASLVLQPPSLPASTFSVPPSLRQSIVSIICIDGIYDLPSLLDEYPTYSSFVNDAFGLDPATLAAESPARWGLYDEHEAERKQAVRVLVLHSVEDELLSLRQPRVFLRRMKQLFSSDGRQSGEASERTADDPVGAEEEGDLPDNVEVDFRTVTGTHNGLLEREDLVQAIAARLP
ncbi:hypothetical protein JCM11251_007073 [Rhodosporidiobolus azoricus]